MRVRQQSWRHRERKRRGQATIEFALTSFFLLLTVFGTIDFGRALFLKSQLETAVREAAREARTRTANNNTCGGISTSLLQHRVRFAKRYADGGGCNQGERPRPGLQQATVTFSCSPSCTSGSKLTVTASLPFQAVTQQFLGIGPLTLRATAQATLE
jgi:hypothetical protein